VTAAAERAAVAALWWAGRAGEAIRVIADGLSDADRAEVTGLLKDPEFARQTSGQLAGRMLDLASKSGVRR
jgi:hypothetical protein